MILFILASLLIGAALGIGLSRLIATRLIGLGAALICAVAAGVLAAGPWTGVTDAVLVLLQLDTIVYSFSLLPAAPERVLAVVLLGASSAAFLLLSIAIAPTIREFGAIFGWALLALAATLLSLLTPITSALLPLAWAVAAIAGYSAVRASGALNQDDRAPQGLILGLIGALALFGAQAGATSALTAGEQPPWPAALAVLIAVIAAGGIPPLSGARAEAPHVPAPLGALLYAIIQPTLALGTLLRFVTALPILPVSWSVVGVAVGVLGALGAAAGALRARQLREVLAWIAASQTAAVLAALLLGDGLALVGAHILLFSLALNTLAAAAAVSVLERSSGSDDYSSDLPGPLLRTAGGLWLIGGAAAIGFPPFFGFWGRRWLLEGLADLAPWGLPALVAAGVLLIPAVLVPIGRFWTPPRPDRAVGVPRFGPQLIGGMVLALLAFLGAAPHLAWDLWLQVLPFAPGTMPITPATALGFALLGGLIGAVSFLLLRLPAARTPSLEREEQPVRLGPDGLSAELAPLALLGRAGVPLRALWSALEWSSNALRTAMIIFEQRYYLFGVLLVLLVLMLLMAQ